MSGTLQFAALTDRGRVRKVNEDAFSSCQGPNGMLFCVADGMGGHQAGEVASRLAADAAAWSWEHSQVGDPLWQLATCIDEANTAVLNEAAQRNMNYGDMGTTIVLMAVVNGAAYVAHVGDSRAYRLVDGSLVRLTLDHTEAQDLVTAGQISPESADHHETSHILTRGLGLEPTVVPDLSGPHALSLGDTFLLCSDGVTGTAHDGILAAMLTFYGLDEALAHMIDHANVRGGPDNSTAIAVRIGAGRGPLQLPPPGFELPHHQELRRRKRILATGLALLVLIILIALVSQLAGCVGAP